MILLRPLHKLLFILRGGLDEQIKRALRLDAGKAAFLQPLIQRLTVPIVGFNIRLFLQTPGNSTLHQRRSVDKAGYPRGDSRGSVNQIIIAHLVWDHQIADALAGERQGFRPAVAHHSIGVILRQIGNLHAVIGQLPIGLIGNQVDIRSELMLLFPQNPAHFPAGFRRIDHAGGVVGVVDDHGLGSGGDFLCKFLKIGLKVRGVGGHHHQRAVVIRHIIPVLGKIRGKGQHLVAGIQERFEDHVQAACRAHGHDDIVFVKIRAEPAVQLLRHRLAHIGVAHVGHIAVYHQRILLIEDLPDGVLHRCGSRNRGIAQREVIDILRAELPRHILALLKHGANHRIVIGKLFHFFRDHFRFSFRVAAWPHAMDSSMAVRQRLRSSIRVSGAILGVKIRSVFCSADSSSVPLQTPVASPAR